MRILVTKSGSIQLKELAHQVLSNRETNRSNNFSNPRKTYNDGIENKQADKLFLKSNLFNSHKPRKTHHKINSEITSNLPSEASKIINEKLKVKSVKVNIKKLSFPKRMEERYDLPENKKSMVSTQSSFYF